MSYSYLISKLSKSQIDKLDEFKKKIIKMNPSAKSVEKSEFARFLVASKFDMKKATSMMQECYFDEERSEEVESDIK